MKKRALKPEWLWIPRWFFFVFIGLIAIYGAFALFRINGNENGYWPGVISGFIGLAGWQLLYIMAHYAKRRIKIGCKFKKHIERSI